MLPIIILNSSVCYIISLALLQHTCKHSIPVTIHYVGTLPLLPTAAQKA